MRKLIFIGLIIAMGLEPIFAAESTGAIFNGNRLVLRVLPMGEISAENGFAAEWPNASGHEYLDMLKPFFMQVGSVNEILNWQPTAIMNGNEVYSNQDKGNWPTEWNGVWPGYHAAGVQTADLEFYTQYENSKRGLTMTVRLWQWTQFTVQNMAVESIEIANSGFTDVSDLHFGIYGQVNVGGDDDIDNIHLDNDVVSISDADGVGSGTGIAKNVGPWVTGNLSIELLESPESNHDGIDNDGDGLVDESRFDGIDNDHDWDVLTDDIGADGIAGTNDSGEADGVPTTGEPNFDIRDWDEAELVNSAGFKVYDQDQPSFANIMNEWLNSSQNADPLLTAGHGFVNFSNQFSLKAGETKRAVFSVDLSLKSRQKQYQHEIAIQLRNNDYKVALAPPLPVVTALAQNKKVTLYWDSASELWPGFQGYKIYKSTDPGFMDIFTITDDHGIKIDAVAVSTFDVVDGIRDLFPLNYFGYRYYLGKDTGLRHSWVDTDVNNGKTYYYAVVGYTTGDAKKNVFPTESMKRITVNPDGSMSHDVNTDFIIPRAESQGFVEAVGDIQHTSGVSTASLSLKIIDRTKIRENADYNVTFDDSTLGYTTFSIWDVTNPQDPLELVQNSDQFSDLVQANENIPLIDGMLFILRNQEVAWNDDPVETKWISGNSNWGLQLVLNDNLGIATPVAADYEVRFGTAGLDTALFTSPIPVPFEIWNVTNASGAYKENLLVLDQNGNGAWDSGELIYIVNGTTLSNFRPIYWSVILTAPSDGSTSVPPVAGDIAQLHTYKPFSSDDVYRITTKSIKLLNNQAAEALKNVAVVPNPYIIHSAFESKSIYNGGDGVRVLHFINLPVECSIKIFNLRGRLVRRLAHSSTVDNGMESWDLKDNKGQTAAYGVYLFYIDTPAGAHSLGRFAIIR